MPPSTLAMLANEAMRLAKPARLAYAASETCRIK